VERPIGGNAGFEATLELRKLLTPRWGLVAFLDVGQVWEGLSSIEAPIWTPGAGIRFLSPVGPLRFDIGYNPSGATDLPVVVQLEDGELLELDSPVLFDPFTFDDPTATVPLLDWRGVLTGGCSSGGLPERQGGRHAAAARNEAHEPERVRDKRRTAGSIHG
jgi:hypothetical protein